jgi:hypothetical protein
MFKYYFRMNFKPLENSDMVPKFQVANACFSGSRPELNASGLYPLPWRLPNYQVKEKKVKLSL